jgi:hypothetical protein
MPEVPIGQGQRLEESSNKVHSVFLSPSLLEAGGTRSVDFSGIQEEERCWICGGVPIHYHCRVVCTHCGFMRDCSDP